MVTAFNPETGDRGLLFLGVARPAHPVNVTGARKSIDDPHQLGKANKSDSDNAKTLSASCQSPVVSLHC